MDGRNCDGRKSLEGVGVTIYATDTPYPDRLTGALHFVLWCDHPDEALPALYAAGADPDACRITSMNTVEAYWITPDQFADMIGMGVTITDKWGLVEWASRRDGREDRLKVLAELRAAEGRGERV